MKFFYKKLIILLSNKIIQIYTNLYKFILVYNMTEFVTIFSQHINNEFYKELLHLHEGKIYIEWYQSQIYISLLDKTKKSRSYCLELEFPNNKSAVNFISSFNQILDITQSSLYDGSLYACAILDEDNCERNTIKKQLKNN